MDGRHDTGPAMGADDLLPRPPSGPASAASRLRSALGRAPSGGRLAGRVRTVLDSPGAIANVGRMALTKAAWLAREQEVGPLAGFLVDQAFDHNPYYERVAARADDRFVRRRIHGYRMMLDTDDPGISRTLLSYGTHEHVSSRVFARELRRLAADTDGDVPVLDVGANIGYFGLLAATALGERARIHAVEPAPENRALLERNVALNGYGDRISVDDCAFGAACDRAVIRLSERSNHHTVHGPGVDSPDVDPTGRTVPVPLVTGERFLAERGIDPGSVRTIRMDLEGAEADVVRGMERVFRAAGPLVVHLEFHPDQMPAADARWLMTLFDEAGFDLVAAVSERGHRLEGKPGWYGRRADVDGFADLLDFGHPVEIVARR